MRVVTEVRAAGKDVGTEVRRARTLNSRALLVALIAMVLLTRLPELLSYRAGSFHDDAVYVVTAKAMAEGKGYVIESLPQELAQTKYPVLFPALLSFVWSIYPEYPANVPLLRLIPFAAFWCWLWLLWVIIARELNRKEVAAWVVALTACSPMSLFFSTALLTETLFSALCCYAILILIRLDSDHRPIRISHALSLAIVMAAAFHTRTIGVTLLPAAAVVLLRRRAYWPTLTGAVLWTVLCMPWVLWQRMHAVPEEGLVYYTSGNYSGWNLLTGGQYLEFGSIVWGNAVSLLAQPLVQWGIPVRDHAWLVLTVGVIAAISSLALLLTRARAAAAWIISTAAILLLWMWHPARFTTPVLPFSMLAIAWAGGSFGIQKLAWAGRLAATTLMISGLVASWPYAWPNDNSRDREFMRTMNEISEAAEWVRTNTPPDAILAAHLDPTFYLLTGRKAVRSFTANPMDLFYSNNGINTQGAPDATTKNLLSRYCASFLIVEHIPNYHDMPTTLRLLSEFNDRWHNALTPLWSSSGSRVIVYGVDLHRIRSSGSCRQQKSSDPIVNEN